MIDDQPHSENQIHTNSVQRETILCTGCKIRLSLRLVALETDIATVSGLSYEKERR
jgi:hypothetical protein